MKKSSSSRNASSANPTGTTSSSKKLPSSSHRRPAAAQQEQERLPVEDLLERRTQQHQQRLPEPTTRIESRNLALPRPLDDQAVVNSLAQLQEKFPAVHEALMRSDDVIGHAETMLFAKQEEVDKCVVVCNQLVVELRELTQQHRALTEKFAVGGDLVVTAAEGSSSPKRRFDDDEEQQQRESRRRKHHRGSSSRRRHDDYDGGYRSDVSSSSSEDYHRRRPGSGGGSSKKRRRHDDRHSSSKQRAAAAAAPSSNMDTLAASVADLLRTMDRFHNNPHLAAGVAGAASSSSAYSGISGNSSAAAAAAERIQQQQHADRVWRTLWFSASANLRDTLFNVAPQWREELAAASAGGLGAAAAADGLNNSSVQPTQLPTMPGTLQAQQYLNAIRAAESIHQQQHQHQHQRGVSPSAQTNESSVSPNGAKSGRSTARSSPNGRGGGDSALLRAAMFELEQSDRIVSQLVMRCSLLEEELGLNQQEMSQLRDTAKRLNSEFDESHSADARRYAALDECRSSLEKRLNAVEADRDKLLEHLEVSQGRRAPSQPQQQVQQSSGNYHQPGQHQQPPYYPPGMISSQQQQQQQQQNHQSGRFG